MQMASFSEFWQFPDSDKVIWQHSSCSEQDFHCTVFDLVKQQRYTSNSYSKIAIGGAVNIAIDLYFLPSLECLLVTLEPQPPSKSANVIETRWKLTFHLTRQSLHFTSGQTRLHCTYTYYHYYHYSMKIARLHLPTIKMVTRFIN